MLVWFKRRDGKKEKLNVVSGFCNGYGFEYNAITMKGDKVIINTISRWSPYSGVVVNKHQSLPKIKV